MTKFKDGLAPDRRALLSGAVAIAALAATKAQASASIKTNSRAYPPAMASFAGVCG